MKKTALTNGKLLKASYRNQSEFLSQGVPMDGTTRESILKPSKTLMMQLLLRFWIKPGGTAQTAGEVLLRTDWKST
jgi:hypothetical protein